MEKNMTYLTLGVVMGLLFCYSCNKLNAYGYKNTGCSNSYATNYDPQVSTNHQDQCTYSHVAFFYMKDTSHVLINNAYIEADSARLPLQLYINNKYVGSINSSLQVAPQTCDSIIPNTFVYHFLNDTAINWTAIGKDSLFVYSGTLQPNSVQTCIQIAIR